MAFGALGSGLLAQYAPLPLELAYWILLGLFLLQAAYLWRLAESVSPQPGAWQSLRPTLHVPVQARRALWLVLPLNLAAWAVGGFYLSLAPSLVRAATGSTSNLMGGALVAVLTLTGALSIYTLRNQGADKILRLAAGLLMSGLALVLIAVHGGSLPLFFLGTLVTGSGFGAGFLGALRSIMPLALPHERAGLMSAFYVLSYLAFSLPSLLAGNLTRVFGLIATTDGYGAILMLLAAGALWGLLRQAQGRAVEQRSV